MNFDRRWVDKEDMARANKLALDIHDAYKYAGETITALEDGYYFYQTPTGNARVDWAADVERAKREKISIAPNMSLPKGSPPKYDSTEIVVTNSQTISGLRSLTSMGNKTLALNFANATTPGGGFLKNSRAQEETLCRQSALYATLLGDDMYEWHRENDKWYEASDWAILSPRVPFYRDEFSETIPEVWFGDLLTCAAPKAGKVGVGKATELMGGRIDRVFQIAAAYQYDALVLGAWGCGAFHNDAIAIANIFEEKITSPVFAGGFERIYFCITDWSEERRFLSPFREVLCGL